MKDPEALKKKQKRMEEAEKRVEQQPQGGGGLRVCTSKITLGSFDIKYADNCPYFWIAKI